MTEIEALRVEIDELRFDLTSLAAALNREQAQRMQVGKALAEYLEESPYNPALAASLARQILNGN